MTVELTNPPDPLPSLDSPSTFNDRALSLFAWLVGTFIPEIEGLNGVFLTGQNFSIDNGVLFVNVTDDRVGINETAPIHQLEVSGTGTVVARVTSPNGQLAGLELVETGTGVSPVTLRFGDDDDNDAGRISYENASDSMRITVNAQLAVHIDNEGNVTLGGGTTDTGKLTTINSAQSAAAIYARSTHASFDNRIAQLWADRAGGSAFEFLRCVSNGAGTPDPETILRGDGVNTTDGSWSGGGADFAEWWEWHPDHLAAILTIPERRGLSVVLVDGFIRPATEEDDPNDIIGAVSASPSVVGDADMYWKKKYICDAFNEYVMEDYNVATWTETVIREQRRTDRDTKEVTFHEIEVEEERSCALDNVPEGVIVPEDAVITTQQRKKLNPDFDPELEYIPREDRDEWVTVGLVGKIRLQNASPKGPRWVKMRDITADVSEWFVRT